MTARRALLCSMLSSSGLLENGALKVYLSVGSIRKHALKNALIPIITVFGVQFSNVLGGSVLAETVFAWPGVGRLVVDAIEQRDIPMVTGALVMTTLLVSVANLIIDIVYAYVDPRIKAQYTK